MAARNARITPGKRLVRMLNKALAPGCEWTETEQIALGLIDEAANRVAVLRELFDVETALPQVSTRRVTELAAEIRQTEATIAKLCARLVPDPDAAPPPKSRQHQAAAMARWHPWFELLGVVAGEAEAMVKSVGAALDPFTDLPDEEREILFETFRVWQDTDASVGGAAEVLFCHPNTVRHRLRRIEKRTGRSLSRPRDVAELCLAFEVHRRLM